MVPENHNYGVRRGTAQARPRHLSVLGLEPFRDLYKLVWSACSCNRRSCRSELRFGRRSISGQSFTTSGWRLRPTPRTTRSRRKAQRLVHDPFGRPETAAIYPRKVKIFEVIEKTSNLNLRNSGANVTLRANLLLS